MAQAIGDGRAQRLERALEALRERFGPWRVTVPKIPLANCRSICEQLRQCRVLDAAMLMPRIETGASVPDLSASARLQRVPG